MGLVFLPGNTPPVGLRFISIHLAAVGCSGNCFTARCLLEKSAALRPSAWLPAPCQNFPTWRGLLRCCRSTESVCAPSPAKPRRWAQLKNQPSKRLGSLVVPKNTDTCPFRVLRRIPGRSYPHSHWLAIELAPL